MLAPRLSVPCRVLRPAGKLDGADACLFVSYSSEPAIKPHVRFHIEALHRRGIKVILIVTVDHLDGRSRLPRIDAAEGIVLRANAGFDFGAWADAFRLSPSLWSAASVLLVNDSVFGPFGNFDAVLAGVRELPADVVGLTDSYQFAHHIQSYFTLLKQPALRNEALRALWRSLANLPTKRQVIRTYEVEMRSRYQGYGLTCAALFPDVVGDGEPLNPLEDKWRELATRGFPYLKVGLLRDNLHNVDLSGWRELVGDAHLLAAIDAELKRSRR